MLVEPRPLGTAAALAWGASEIVRRAGPETVFCCIHADLAVAFPEFFRQTVVRAATCRGAREGARCRRHSRDASGNRVRLHAPGDAVAWRTGQCSVPSAA